MRRDEEDENNKISPRKYTGGGSSSSSSSSAQCQRCLQVGHWTYQCKNEAAYLSRPSRTSFLQKPSLERKYKEKNQVIADGPPQMER